MRKTFVAGNWKMYKTREEAEALVKALIPLIRDANTDVALCPPFTNLETVARLIQGTNLHLGAQNCHYEIEGAFTGEISPAMLQKMNCDYCIVGHSERRQYFGETDDLINRKAKALLTQGVLPIICVGETLEQREGNQTQDVVVRQVRGCFEGLTPQQAKICTIAYEPVWAIGTGKTATPEQAQEVHALIRNLIREMYDGDIAQTVRIQYGGSVKPGNAAELFAKEDIDGGLIGGASLKAEDFAGIVNAG